MAVGPAVPTPIPVAMVFGSTSIPTAAPTPQHFSLVDEDDDVSPCDGDIRSRKKRVVNAGGGGRGDVDGHRLRSLRDDRNTYWIKYWVDVLVHHEGEAIESGASDGGLLLLRQEQASSTRAIVGVSLSTDVRGKSIAEEDVGSNSDMDLNELRMIYEGLTQLEVRMKEVLGLSRSLWIVIVL